MTVLYPFAFCCCFCFCLLCLFAFSLRCVSTCCWSLSVTFFFLVGFVFGLWFVCPLLHSFVFVSFVSSGRLVVARAVVGGHHLFLLAHHFGFSERWLCICSGNDVLFWRF
eukprot:TRINITY_DN2368_c0_g1_i5.p4 TRINITY_DN2368_c0_g1~~TRINITY_DN2368_c0_g1_i5.p4  ORF type:complete len:110 (-),score=7.05 TRINITY_DN2368_c0_g1_i5:12-341(-)